MKTLATLFLVAISFASFSQNYQPSDMVPSADSSVQSYIEHSIVDRINEYRVTKGLHELRVDTLLKPAAVHHAMYMRHTHDLTHDELEDVPNFTEYKYPSTRYLHLIDNKKFWGISENLLSDLILFNKEKFTFEYVIEHTVTNGYKTCGAHWRDLMSDEYDSIYIFYDMNHNNPDDYGAAITCTVILGVSSDSYKQELGI